MKFKDMPYSRPDLEAVKNRYKGYTEKLRSAKSFEDADAAFIAMEKDTEYACMSILCSIRHSIDTRDEFYDNEKEFFNEADPEIEEYEQGFLLAMYNSPFRPEFEKKYPGPYFLNTEFMIKSFSPKIIPMLQKENALAQSYEKLLASGKVDFEGGSYTLSQMSLFKSDDNDERRLAAWKAEGRWYKDNQAELDRLYDELVKLRDSMGREMGYGGYIPMAYYRMQRTSYGKEDVEAFRKAVVSYVVPLADKLARKRAERLGVKYPLSFADYELDFRSGNPRPVGSPDEILAQGKRFYDTLSPETAEFFDYMTDNEMLDLLSKEGKASGGYCEDIPGYNVPFIFANFNGTQADVEVVTHEAGHAFADWMNRNRIPRSYCCPGMEACEVHSMSMEFFAWSWADKFFGADADKFRFSHLASALEFLPYGTMVDHFQHIVFEKPDMTPRERHDTWRELLGIYMPYLRLDGDIPFWSDGEGWQYKHHIYSLPFYYIDYCLAQTVALEFWAKMQKDRAQAWKYYMAYTTQGGTESFTELLKNAGLDSPFELSTLKTVCEAADSWLEEFSASNELA